MERKFLNRGRSNGGVMISTTGNRDVLSKCNCWEFNGCGRELGGARAHELGPCPASTEKLFHGLYSGKNAGRSCWLVARTLGGGVVQKKAGKKREKCRKCAFFHHVIETEYPELELGALMK